jgi:hypothetical protein
MLFMNPSFNECGDSFASERRPLLTITDHVGRIMINLVPFTHQKARHNASFTRPVAGFGSKRIEFDQLTFWVGTCFRTPPEETVV